MCWQFWEYCCVQCAKTENQNLFWLRANQSKIGAELYNLCHNSSIQFLKKNRKKHYFSIVIYGDQKEICIDDLCKDEMAKVLHFHKPDFFITVTWNPNWLEIELLEEPIPSLFWMLIHIIWRKNIYEKWIRRLS
jgi:hypothetical protein